MYKQSGNIYFGVVEDRFDPQYLGRVRVRVFGLHPVTKVRSDISGMPVEDLLWMDVMQPTTSGAISGVGTSPTGLMEGTHVVVIFKDKYFQDGLVIGTYAGRYNQQPDINFGFCDPTGQFPRYIGNDVNTLARAGKDAESTPPAEVQTPVSVEEQNLNTDDAPQPDNTPADELPETVDPGDFTLETMLRMDEGIRIKVYWDTEGYPTIGIGHLIIAKKTKNTQLINQELSKHVGRTVTDSRITEAECSQLFAKDVATVKRDLQHHKTVGPVYAMLDSIRKMALENMVFQMGVGGVAEFKKALGFMALKKWEQAAAEMLNSLWARQTPGRANRVSRIIRFGNLASYGVTVKPAASRRRRRSISLYAAPEQSGNLFEEPKSSYGAQYPYNFVYESEAGHIQEFDSTPGHERYHRKHPTGTFEEVQPDGTRVVKIVGDDYLIVKAGRNVKVSGNLNIVVEGNCTQYVMGNVSQTVDGNVKEFVRGNVNSHVEGFVNAIVDKDARMEVRQNCELLVKQNLQATVEQSANVVVNEQADVTVGKTATVNAKDINVNATDTMNLSAKDINIKAGNNLKLDGSTLAEVTGGTVKVG